jgi:hypothetical protein
MSKPKSGRTLDTFCGRLKGAMMAQGLHGTPEELARLVDMPLPVARKWMRMRSARVYACELVTVAKRLRVRLYWLATGTGVPARAHMHSDAERRVMTLLNEMTAEQAERWISRGRRIAHS